jgi:L-ascorbate metabolism protein UlaG (beta-lactamase superfamily)
MIFIVLAGIVLFVYLFLNYYPAFGGKAPKRQKFENLIPTVMDMNSENMFSMLKDYMRGNPNRRPPKALPIEKVRLPLETSKPKITWFGHSTFLIEINGKTLLLDPMFGRTPSPFPMFGAGRFSQTLPLRVEDLPEIDIVLISHDHYDHLDHGSINKIKDKVKQFLVPLGVGSHLVRWGVNPARIQELNWWDELSVGEFNFACTPARHFSGRNVTNRDSTLWCSWVIKSKQTSLFFSGDSGYGPHFKEIGEKYGPFELTLMECGQYDRRWESIHMFPEQTVEAHMDVRGKWLIPIHWGAFTLSFHDWTDPIERVTKAANEKDVKISTPKIGESVTIGSEVYPQSAWWR